jgi:carboxypeptidase Taq
MQYSTKSSESLYEIYVEKMQRIADVKYAEAVLQWDQETYLPSKGANARARQLATLSETAHNFFVDAELGNLLEELYGRNDLNFVQQKNITLTRDEYQKQKKFSSAFVRQLSETISASFHAWIHARKENNFAHFIPSLEKLLSLKKEEAFILGFKDHPYNALLHEYEKSASVKMLDDIFETITIPLKKIIETVISRPQTDDHFLHQYFNKQEQWNWGMMLLKEIGFDFEAGRQDISEHPFTTNFSAKDVRITTRIDEHDFANMTWSCLHEMGHALYEQGIPDDQYGLPSGEYSSLSIHESQSRFWENHIGRNKSFWKHYYPQLQQAFPQQFANISDDQFYKAISKVQPSLIRTEADELTYHFHVKIRYIIEKELMEGKLAVHDIKERWNYLYNDNLGVIVPDDVRGCLQDVHWSHGSFGYFPTYSLGSMYAAQFWLKIKEEKPEINLLIERASFSEILVWLRNKIHCNGKLYNSEELCSMITGKQLQAESFLQYAGEKFL